jgi:hypothetical protein
MTNRGWRRSGGPETRGRVQTSTTTHECRLARDLWAQGSGGPLVAEGARKARDETPAKASDTEGRMTSRSTGGEVSRALVDDIPVV